MTDFLKDQARFMRIVGQTVGQNDVRQTAMYECLLDEELQERVDAVAFEQNEIEEFDADLDILVVHLGRMLSRWPVEMIEAGWAEVMRSNLSKAVECGNCSGSGYVVLGAMMPETYCAECSATGYVVQRREDGKIQKGPQYSPPDLKSVMEKFK